MNENSSPSCRNVVTVDVEDYFHASAFRKRIPFETWDNRPSRVEANTRRVLKLLAEFHLQATFFVLGWVAERYPALVREIVAAGHELGCHSYAHRLIYELTPAEFRADTRRAVAAIEDAAGMAVHAYRAPSFSITGASLWALEVLAELGFKVDSSIFPIRNGLYGIPGAPRQPFRIRVNGISLLEYPLPTVQIGPWNFPVTGGFYLRSLPGRLQVHWLTSMARRAQPAVLYFHPWELDPGQPRVASRFGSKFYHYMGLKRTERRLRRLFHTFQFGKLSESSAAGAPLYEIGVAGASKGESARILLQTGGTCHETFNRRSRG
jgi:polysaccharide deacetylase family protein (PEP-CTERM system associated)